MAYDDDNIFAKILRGEIPCNKVYEDDYVLAFNDITPQRPVHVLVIPKGRYVTMEDYCDQADDQAVAALFRAVGKIARDLNLDQSGYRVICNNGADGHQEVPHLHVHILGGAPSGPMVKRMGS